MKKSTSYIILFLVALAIGALLLTGTNEKKKEFDNRITLQKDDKIPYGAYIAYEHLKYLFPNASVLSTRQEPGSWDSLSSYDTAQVLLIVSPRFYADEFEMKKLIRFADKGNDVFISARFLSSDVERMIQGKSSIITTAMSLDENGNPVTDSITFRLRHPPFGGTDAFSYRGLNYHSWFYQLDSSISSVLGSNEIFKPNFIHLKAGRGNIYLHLAPLAFSNYFLLQGNNMAYYENALSVISPNVRKVVWDEYYLNKLSYYDDDSFNRSSSDSDNEDANNPLSELMRYRETKWALLLAIFILLLYVIMEGRRRQRYIPVITKPRNDSLDFVKTIGRLYYDKGDHKNLSRKMAAYFREHVRNNYKLPTSNLDEEFMKKLQFKTACSEDDIRPIVNFINKLEGMPNVSAKQMAEFHRQLEIFYQKA